MPRFIGIERHRIATDGVGVTTLAAFHGCPLNCKYCLNEQCKTNAEQFNNYTPEQLLEEVTIDNLYFQATGGGICFGGGEPLLHPDFIAQFKSICPPQWKISIETSLAVKNENLVMVAGFTDLFIIDIKDLNPSIYKSYTDKSNNLLLENIHWLANHNMQEKCKLRLPLIKDYNTKADIASSRQQLEEMGFHSFDDFSYITRE